MAPPIYCVFYHIPVVSLVQISPSLCYHLSLLTIAFGSSSRLHPVSIQSCCRCSSWFSNTWSSVWGVQRRFRVLISPVVSSMSHSSYLDGFRDGRVVAIQLLLCRMILQGFVHGILVQLPSSLFSINFVSIHVVVWTWLLPRKIAFY